MGNDEEIGGGNGFDRTMKLKTALYVAHVSFIMILCMPELKAGNGGVPLAVTTKTD